MKFYFVYEHAFPLGFGLSALLFLSVGMWGILARRALNIPFVVTFLTYLGILVPLFLLSLNHFLEAWPLDFGTIVLNGIGVIIPPIWLLALWLARFERTAIGYRPDSLKEFFEASQAESKTKVPFRRFLGGIVCYVGVPEGNSENFTEQLDTKVLQQDNSKLLMIYFLAIFAGGICALTGAISWCSATLCVASVNI